VHRAVFIDRDGVICRNRVDHVKSWDEFEFLPGVLGALARLAHSDLCIIVVTNQAIVNRRLVSGAVVDEIHERMVRAVGAAGGRVERVMCCPHRPDEGCSCRKPQPGLLLRAAQELDIDLTQSYLVGDAKSDMEAGRAAGCEHRYLVLTGRGRQQLVRCWLDGEHGFRVAANLSAAVRAILGYERRLAVAPAPCSRRDV
jgi:D-glycero-D-manno-heptose 1,7-bisphosphate phosphatase